MKPIKSRVAWCNECEIWMEENYAGSLCPLGSCERKLRLRVGYICRDRCEWIIFFQLKDYLEHCKEEHDAFVKEVGTAWRIRPSAKLWEHD